MLEIILLVIEVGVAVVLLGLLVEVVVEAEGEPYIGPWRECASYIEVCRNVGRHFLAVLVLGDAGCIDLGVILQTYFGVELIPRCEVELSGLVVDGDDWREGHVALLCVKLLVGHQASCHCRTLLG